MTRLIEFDKYVHNSYLLVVKLFHGSQIIPRYHLLLISLYHSELWEMDFTLIPVLYSGSCWPSIVHFTEKWSSPHYQPCAQSSHRSRTNNLFIKETYFLYKKNYRLHSAHRTGPLRLSIADILCYIIDFYSFYLRIECLILKGTIKCLQF